MSILEIHCFGCHDVGACPQRMREREEHRVSRKDFYDTNTFLHLQKTRDLLQQHHAHIRSYYESPDLDFGFYSEGKDPTLVPLHFYGHDNCVGMCVPRFGEKNDAFVRRLENVNALLNSEPEFANAVIIAGTSEQIELMRKADEKPVFLHSGDNGTEQKSSNGEKILERRLRELITRKENAVILHELGIAIAPNRGKLTMLFVDAENGHDRPEKSARLVNIQNLRIARTKKVEMTDDRGRRTKQNTFDEQVTAEGMCAGIFVPDVSAIEAEIFQDFPNLQDPKFSGELRTEVKRRLYDIAEHIRRSLVQYESDPDKKGFYIAVALDGQLSLWERSGFLRDVPPFREGAVRPREVINALFYDNEGHRKGPLAQMGITFKTRSVTVEGVDLSFYKKDADGISQPYGVTLWGYGKDLSSLIPYANIYGIMLVEQNLPLDKRKVLTRINAGNFRTWEPFSEAGQLLTVDKNLVELWKERGTPVVTETESASAQSEMSAKKLFDYTGQLPPLKDVSLVINQPGPEISGNQMFLTTNHDDITRAVFCDFCLRYSADPVSSSFPNRPSYAVGIGPYIESGMLPKVRRAYRTDLLVQSLTSQPLHASLHEYSFIMSELFHRLGWEKLTEEIRVKIPSFTDFESLKKQLSFFDEKYYQHHKTVFDMALLTHAHSDHYGGMSFLRPEIPLGLSHETTVFLRDLYRRGWHFSVQEIIAHKEREVGKSGGKYPVVSHPLITFADGQTRQVSPDVLVTGSKVNHSILGTMAYAMTVVNNLGNPLTKIAYLADFREGALTSQTIDRFKDANVLILEGTNFSGKPSIGITEERVAQNLDMLRSRADAKGGAFVVQMAPNNIERLKSVIGGAGRRKVCVPVAIAQILHEFAILNEKLPYDQQIDVPKLGEDVFILKDRKMTYYGWEHQLMETYGAVQPDEFFAHPSDFIGVVSPYKSLLNFFAGYAGGGIVVRSASWPYDAQDKKKVLSDKHHSDGHNLEYIADIDFYGDVLRMPDRPMGVHASGHIEKEGIMDTALTFAKSGNLDTVIYVHTEHPGMMADQITTLFRQEGVRDVRMVSKIKKGGMAIPINY